ncbi:hypothetical protein C8A03DRAFT_12316 [Achaetomium macrosporum]|uniref:Telomeric single stranded DNA binding POT1/Cdc13 domain-containing protein n=1 Tax=Achaetomium macrosporum TaxID=79813 RepID=A0AAN7CIH8_9PEZI|nr:hypothetical protein C8A03DRAFT_12316 [Achaetomium macrosporum]
MASVNGDSAAQLASQTPTPIAQLNPELSDQSSRVVRGEITITWPYSFVNRTFAFLLAESDVRLRRARGQVRIEFRGPSAKAASECGLGAGDELLFSLEGVEWAKDVSPARIPGARVEWQLQFNEKLVLQVKSGESGEVKHINIDHHAAQSPDGAVLEPPKAATPEPEPTTVEVQSAIRKISEFPANEYPSPAFVKRARLSYGALFEGGFDIFEEDGGVRGKGRKRTRFEHGRSVWRYSSQSPSPEPTSPIQDEAVGDASSDVTPQPSPQPQTTDEGCHTIDIEMTEAAPESAQAAVAQPAQPPAPASQEGPTAPMQEDEVTMHQVEDAPAISAPGEKSVPVVEEGQVREESVMATEPTTVAKPHGRSVEEQSQERQAQEQPISETRRSSPPPANAKSTPFGGPWPLGSNFSMFGTGAPARVESTLSLADQVRFGFSHIPQTTRASSPPKPEHDHQPHDHTNEPYPASYLNEGPSPAKYTDMNTYINAADEQGEMAVHGQPVAPEPPTVERFGQGQLEMSTQPPHYNAVEGGHFGTDALEEGARVTAGHASPHASGGAIEKVPEGFASYGHGDESDRHQDSPPREESSHEGEPLVENEDTISEDEVGVDDEEDEDAKYDEYAYGEQLEEGDYDQRNYEIPDDDDEGLSEEDDEAELEAEERYGNAETYDEDGEGEEWDEEDEEEGGEDEGDEDEYESGEEDYEEDYDMRGYQPRKAAAPAPTGEPVVISLLSDSEDEDEDEPASPPSKSAAPTPPAPVQHPPPPISFRKASRPTPERSPRILKTVETDSVVKDSGAAPSNIFSQTQVVDFAERLNKEASQQPKVPPAEADTAPESATFTSQAPRSFEVSNARGESHAPESEPAPSEGSSEGLFVSQSKPEPEPEPAPSEKEEKSRGDSMSVEEMEQTGFRGESMSVEEADEGESTPRPVKAQDDALSLPDADDAAFVSQVEMDQDTVESEDEHMGTQDTPSKPTGAVEEAWSTIEVQEVTISEMDVDMLDAGSPQVESTSSVAMTSQSPQQESSAEIPAFGSELMVSEVVSEAAVSIAADKTIPSAQMRAEQEAELPSTPANGQELAKAERLQQILRESPNDEVEVSVVSTEGSQERANQEKIQPTPLGVNEGPLGAQESAEEQLAQGPIRDAVRLPAEAQREAHEGVPAGTETIKATQSVGSPELGEKDDPEDQAAELSSQAEEDGAEQAAEKAEESAQQTLGPKLAQQATSPAAEDLNEETMILEQLTQEQLAQEQQQFTEPEAAEARSPSPDISVGLAREALASPSKHAQELQKSVQAEAAEGQVRTRSPSPDPSASLAREALASPSKRGTRRRKKAPESVRTSPRVTRARSSSLRSDTTAETEDLSVSLAREALASPSRRGASPTTTTTATLKSELTKRLRTELPECIPLESLRTYVNKFTNAVVVVTSQPSAPTRAKGGPREYFMSFHVTDPSTAPSQVVEVQLYRPHKDSLPAVKPGDVILLQKFQVKALSKKGFGLRTGVESAWAVWNGGDGPPQVKGPPVEDWEGYVAYVKTLREWFGLLVADEAARAKLEKADRKLEEAGAGGGK